MKEIIENIEKVISNWLDSADKNHSTMQHLIDSKDYNWALFMGHLVIEKTLKAVYVKKKNKHALLTHDLLRLAISAEIDLNEEQKEWLDKITTFNINARYDNYKQDFLKLCNKEFTDIWVNRIEVLKKWLINQL